MVFLSVAEMRALIIVSRHGLALIKRINKCEDVSVDKKITEDVLVVMGKLAVELKGKEE